MIEWIKTHGGNALKAAAIVIGVGGSALTFFTSLKTDVAVLQATVQELKIDTGDTNRKVDRLYDAFIGTSISARDKI